MSTTNIKPDSPNTITISENKNQLTITNNSISETINITTSETKTVNISAPGPQGPEGPVGSLSTSDSLNITNITASGVISASGGFVGDGTNITGVVAAGTISSSLQFGSSDNVTFNHITASGNISSSGTLYANQIELASHLYIPDSIVHAADTNTKIRFPDVDTISFHTSGNEQMRINSVGNITASGNISSSGTGTNYFSGDVKIGNGADILLEEDQRLFFEADKQTWIESHAADSFRVVAGGNQMLLLDYTTGNRAVFGNGTKVYIGANNNYQPSQELVVGVT